MAIINGKALVKDGKPLDRVYSNGKLVYGRNLITGTSNDIKTATGGYWLIRTIGEFSYENSHQYTASVKIEVNNYPMFLQAWQADINGNRQVLIKTLVITSFGIASFTFNAPEKNDGKKIILQLAWTNGDVSGSYYWRQAKAEKGATITPWTPAPEDYI